jgi:hypothetical protein
MKPIWVLLALGAFGLAACDQTGSPGGATSGMAAGDSGPGFCEGPPPEDPNEMTRWNDQCFPGGDR